MNRFGKTGLIVWGSRSWLFMALIAAFIAAALFVQLHIGAYDTDRGQTSDEAAHFVTSLMIADYLHHPSANPIAFAKDYYVHLPRVAIGHWPPVFELLQALVFGIFGGTNATALLLQALIAGLLAGVPSVLVARQLGVIAGLLTGLLIFCSRNILFEVDTVMADNLLGLLVFLFAWAWSLYYRRRSAGYALLFAAALISAILTKGTAIGLLLLPVAHVALMRDWRFLFRARTLAALGAVVILTAAWYVLTYRLAANGWNYSWGSFTALAVPFFGRAFVAGFGIPATAVFLFGAWCALRPRETGPLDVPVFALAALVQFAFILVVPADLQTRYLVPVYPCAAVVAVWGLWRLLNQIFPSRIHNPLIVSGLASLLVLISIWQGFQAPHIESFRTREAFAKIGAGKNPLVLISGSSRFEGAMVATIAQADHARFLYALRASKMLSSSSFMGNGYRTRFDAPAQMQDWLLRNQIGWIVIDTSPDSMRYPHNRMLLALAESQPKLFYAASRTARPDGTIAVFKTRASATTPQHKDSILAEQAPGGIP
jgi:hypothetical protein